MDLAKFKNLQNPLPREIKFHKARIIDKKQDAFKENFIHLTKEYKSTAQITMTEANLKEEEEDSLLREPKFYLYPKGKVYDSLEWKEAKKIGAGLYNLGNTCFLNSTLQCLLYAPLLNNYLLSREHSQSCSVIGFCSICEMEKLAAESCVSKKPIAPKKIVSNLKSNFPQKKKQFFFIFFYILIILFTF